MSSLFVSLFALVASSFRTRAALQAEILALRFVVLSHERRRVVHFGVTERPTQEWTLQQMREAFPWDQAPRYVLRDRDAIYGSDFAAMTRNMGMEEGLLRRDPPGKIPWNG